MDWWSVGVLTYELLTGASPFTVEGEKNTQQEISKRILKSDAPMPGFLSDDVKDFILKLLVKEPRKRLGGGVSDAEEVKTRLKHVQPLIARKVRRATVAGGINTLRARLKRIGIRCNVSLMRCLYWSPVA